MQIGDYCRLDDHSRMAVREGMREGLAQIYIAEAAVLLQQDHPLADRVDVIVTAMYGRHSVEILAVRTGDGVPLLYEREIPDVDTPIEQAEMWLSAASNLTYAIWPTDTEFTILLNLHTQP